MTELTKQRILLLTENFPPIEGGSGRWFWELYSRLPKDQVTIVTHSELGAENFDQTHDLNVVRMHLRSAEWGFKSLTGLHFYWRTVRALVRIIKQRNITHIHCGRVIHEGVTAWLLSKITKIKYLCYVHGEDVQTAATSREQALLVRAVCKRSEVIICNSNNSANLVVDLKFANRAKCKVLHPGVDTERFTIAERDEKFLDSMGWAGKTVLLTVGRLQRRKGQDMMIKAMSALLSRFPNLFYAIVGRGECKAELESLIDEYQISSNVQVYPEVDDRIMIQCYQQCDAFILPNRTIGGDIEGFGMVLIEAQACGQPVIAGNSGGTKEALKPGETGFVIDCNTPESIENNLSELLTRERLAFEPHKIRQYVVDNFDWRAHVVRAQAIFNQCL